ncbi:MAG TPA: hypothetical protein VM328_04560, partial [Fimbriimonadaceae bacterium]|nr:hypothetical protein [Fimbriimonadaceae bacterium]
MKLKNVSFIEQHFEKLWVAASVVVLLLVGWIFLMGDPHATTIDGQTRSPAKIDPHIVAKAQQLQEAANSDEVPEWATQKMVPYA